MVEKEDKEKAEKLAAAKKRVAQLQKKKKAAGGEKGGASSSKKAKDADKSIEKVEAEDSTQAENVEAAEGVDPAVEIRGADAIEESKDQASETKAPAEEDNDDVAAFNAAINSSSQPAQDEEDEDKKHEAISPPTSPSNDPSSSRPQGHSVRQPSISLQSKIRSASFRQGASPASPTPEDSDLPDIYRKQMARIEELEKENKRLAKEAQESQARWQKNEEELEEMREKAAEEQKPTSDEEVSKLKSEIDTLRRTSRQSISVPKQKTDVDVENLRKELESKDATISDMQLEISRLRSSLSAQTEGSRNENEQISALQDSLQRVEMMNARAQQELQDTKKALSRASEKAVVDGTERTSKETKIKALEREVNDLTSARAEADKKVETMEKKIEAMSRLHRETDQRNAPKLASAEAALRELQLVKAKVEAIEKENLRLREARKATMTGDGSVEGLDELEDEERQKLKRRIRELESENFDLRRGVWRDRRQQMQPNLSKDLGEAGADDFDEVDLNGSGVASRKSSTMHQPPMQTRHSGFAQVFNSGLAAFRASTTSPDSQTQRQTGRARNDSLLEEFDDDAFDENAFAVAQREEEMRKMVEHVREVKKGLKQWQDWRLDLVDLRRSSVGGMGFGEIFEV